MPSFFTRRKSSTSNPLPVPTLARRPSVSASASSQDSPLSTSANADNSSPKPPCDDALTTSSSPAAHPPSYISTTLPVAYSFIQNAPFAMILKSALDLDGPPLYYISLGLNVWMPGSSVTYVRRGGDVNGPLVAQLEMGTSIGSANITFADEYRPVGSVMFRKSANSSSKYYFTGDGTIVRWKIGLEEWEASTNSLSIATFRPSLASRTLTLLEENAYTLLDHLVLSLLVLMREHLAPKMDGTGLLVTGSPGGSELANQEW